MKFFKRPLFIIPAVIVILVIMTAIYYEREEPPAYEFVTVQRGELIQEVSVTGRIKPADKVELAFESGGKVARVYVDVGDEVKIGQIIATLENGELTAQLLAAEADLETEEAKLKELQAGTRPEEIQAAETKVSNAQRSLNDAETDLANVKNKAEVDKRKVYNDALAAIQKSVSVGKIALVTLTDIQYASFAGSDEDSNAIAAAKAAAVESLLGASGAGRLSQEFISNLSGGAFGAVEEAVGDNTYLKIDKAVKETSDALQKVKKALDAVPVSGVLTATQKTNLSSEKANINAEITSVSDKKQSVDVQIVLNDKNIASAEASVNIAKNNLAVAEDDLNIKKSGAAPEQIFAQESKVKAARAGVQKIQAQIVKTLMRAPFGGIITKKDIKAGEIVSAGSILVSLISKNAFEIETNVPEADIAKVKVGDGARVTLDAYGSEVLFETRVVSIDPAETVIEGVSTYKTTLQFIGEDGRIRSGMTANIDILTDRREDVIAVPARAVAARGREKIVRVLSGGFDESGKAVAEEVKVETGLRGSDGRIEISSGLKEGDRVIIFTKEK